MSATDEKDTDKGRRATAAVAASAAIAAVAGQLLHEDATGADAGSKAGRDPFDDLVPPPAADAAAAPMDSAEPTGTTVEPTPATPTPADAVGSVAVPVDATGPAGGREVPDERTVTGAAAPSGATELPDASIEPTSSSGPVDDLLMAPTSQAAADDAPVEDEQSVGGSDAHTDTPVPTGAPVSVTSGADDPTSAPLPQGVDGDDVVFGTAPSGPMGASGAGRGGTDGAAGDGGPGVAAGPSDASGTDSGPVYVAPQPIELGAPNPLLVVDPAPMGALPTDDVIDDPFAAQRAAAMEAAAKAAEHNDAQLQSQAGQQAFEAAQAQAQAAMEIQQQQQSYAAELLERATALLHEQSIAAFASMTAQSFDLDDKIELWQEIKVLNPALTGGPQQLAPFVSQNATMEQIAEHFGVDIVQLAHAVALEENPQFTIADIVESRSDGAIDIGADVIVVTMDGVDVLLNADGNVTFDSGPEGAFQSLDFAEVTPGDWDTLEGFAGLYHLPAD